METITIIKKRIKSTRAPLALQRQRTIPPILYRIILLVLILIMPMSSVGQDMQNRVKLFKNSFTSPIVPTRLRDIENQKKRVNNLIRKNPKLSSIKGLRQYHILEMYPCGRFYEKKDIESATFLQDLEYGYYSIGKKKYMRDITIITDSIGNIVAHGNANILFVPTKWTDEACGALYSEIAKLLFKGDVEMAFYTIQYPNRIVCLHGEDLYVLESTVGNLNFWEWKSFCSHLFNEEEIVTH